MNEMKIYTLNTDEQTHISYYLIEDTKEIVIDFHLNRMHLEAYQSVKYTLDKLIVEYKDYQFCIDMSNVSSIGSTVIGVFIKFCIDNNRKLYLYNCQKIVKKVLDILELDEIIVVK